MTIILSLDTSTEACSCALSRNGVVSERYDVIPRGHAQQILPMIQSLLDEQNMKFQDLDAVAFGRGPGSFTGLRIAAGVAQGIAFAAQLPVIPVSTLAALALLGAQTNSVTQVFSAIDARIDEVYWGCFEIVEGLPCCIGEEQLCKPENISLPGSNFTEVSAVGSGLIYSERYPQAVLNCFTQEIPELLPRATQIARIAESEFAAGRCVPPDQASPVYLRDKVTR